MKMTKLWCLPITIINFCLAGNTLAATNYYLSPTGNDTTGDGSSAAPWKTLHKARDAARALSRPLAEEVNIILKNGTYELTSTLELTAADSGTNTYKVTYKAENPGQVTISGGSVITGWSDANNDGIWQASVPSDSKSRELYVNDVPATRARSVNGSGWGRNGNSGQYNAPASAANWANKDKIELVTQYLWKEYRGRVASISGSTATMNSSYWDLAKIGPFGILDNRATHVNWVENAFELLDAEGEWYLNESTNVLYYKPKVNENLTGGSAVEVVLPKLEKMLTANGASHVNFEGLTFAHSTWLKPSEIGYVSIQSATVMEDPVYATIEDAFDGSSDIPASINLDFAQHVQFKNNSFKNIGGIAIGMGRGSKSNTLFNNSFNNLGSSAISAGNPIDSHAPQTHVSEDNIIDNNNITNVGLQYHDSSAIKMTYTDGIVVSNNTIKTMPYTGISLGWGWGRYDVDDRTGWRNDAGQKGYNSATVQKGNIIFRNRISDFCNFVCDGGGIYNLGANPGTRIAENLVFDGHTSGTGTHFVNGIYLDNGSRGIEVNGNGVYDVTSNGFFFNGNGVNQPGTFNTSGNNTYRHTESNANNMPSTLLTNAGQQSSIASVRSKSVISGLLPTALTPVPGAAMPQFGILVGSTATATANSSSAVNIIDGNPRTYWDAGSGNTSGTITIDSGNVNNEWTSFVVAFGKVDASGLENYILGGMTYTIAVSNDQSNWTNLVNVTTPLVGRPAQPHYFNATKARYMRLSMNSANGDFGVLRFKGYGVVGLPQPVGNNIATSGIASQVSTAHGGVASRAIDGNTNGNYFVANSTTHTDLADQAYWTLDLGSVQNLTEIRIYNRSDCCADRLTNYEVFVSDVAFTGTTVADSTAQAGVGKYSQSAAGGNPVTRVVVNRSGRYVRVQLNANNQVLSLAEVEVYAQANTPPTNLALAGTASQSSTLNAFGQSYGAARAIDDNTNGNLFANSVTHTDLGSQNYWQLDLGAVKTINNIKIWNRTECCGNRLTNFHVLVSDVPFSGPTLANAQGTAGVFDHHNAGAASTTTDVSVNRTGRYVRIQLANTNASSGENVLSLAEVQVFGQ